MLEIIIKKRGGNMANTDTIKLLKECDAGSKMAVSSIDDVLGEVESSTMQGILRESREHHEKLGNEIHEKLNELHDLYCGPLVTSPTSLLSFE